MRGILWLVLAEVLAYPLVSLYSPSSYAYFGFSALALEDGQFWTLLTSLFVHVNLIHLTLNMFLLLIFGSILEAEEGSTRALLVFFAGGAGSLLLGIPLYAHTTTIVGSSVGVSAVAGATLLMKPRTTLPWYLFHAPVGLFATIYLVFNVFLAVTDSSGLVAYPSHVLAFALGVVILVVLKETYKVSERRDVGTRADRPRTPGQNQQ